MDRARVRCSSVDEETRSADEREGKPESSDDEQSQVYAGDVDAIRDRISASIRRSEGTATIALAHSKEDHEYGATSDTRTGRGRGRLHDYLQH